MTSIFVFHLSPREKIAQYRSGWTIKNNARNNGHAAGNSGPRKSPSTKIETNQSE